MMMRGVAWEDRLWSRIEKRGKNECWLYSGFSFTLGYGRIKVNGKQEGAHRAAFESWWGVTLPSWLFVCHDCPDKDNRACCNPSHLWVGTHDDNIQDAKLKGRTASGDRNGSRLYPERLRRGDNHPFRLNPEKAAHGDRCGPKLYPDRYPKGDEHWTRLRPENLARGLRNGAHTKPECRSSSAGSKNGQAKLNDKQVYEMLDRYQAGERQASLARDYGVTPSAVCVIISGEKWGSVRDRWIEENRA